MIRPSVLGDVPLPSCPMLPDVNCELIRSFSFLPPRRGMHVKTVALS
jgi:hypothetical protein